MFSCYVDLSQMYICQSLTVHSGPDPLETIFVKIEKSLQNLQNASKSYNTPEFCAQLKHKLQK